MKYKLHCRDDDGQIVSSVDIVAKDDLDALAEAEKRCAQNAVELWRGELRVARVKKGNAPLDASDRMSL